MGNWHVIETGVCEALQALNRESGPLFATVRAALVLDRKTLIATISREPMPAAYVQVTGRGTAERTSNRPGRTELRVTIAARSLRGTDDTRVGGVDSPGLFEVVEQAAARLAGLAPAPGHRLVLMEEGGLPGDGGTAMWEQKYAVQRAAETQPEVDGLVVTGATSTVGVTVGDVEMATPSFAFPGIDGVFERTAGWRGRLIHWHGTLRTADDAELNGIEATLEAMIGDSMERSVSDGLGRVFEPCVVRAFRRQGPRRRDELTGEAVQDFEMEFKQLRM